VKTSTVRMISVLTHRSPCSTVSEEVIVVTSTNGQIIFEIEDPLEEQKAKKTKISDDKMFEEFFLD
jgi:hypothetical protein